MKDSCEACGIDDEPLALDDLDRHACEQCRTELARRIDWADSWKDDL